MIDETEQRPNGNFLIILLGSVCVAASHFAGMFVGSVLLAFTTGAIVMRRMRAAGTSWLLDSVLAVISTWTAGSAIHLVLSHIWRHLARFL